MPLTPYAKLIVTVNGGAPVTGGVHPAVGDTILLRGESTVGWTQQKFEVYDYPVGMALPAGWTDSGAGSYYYATDPFPPSFPASPGGKFMLRLTANNGLNSSGQSDPTLIDASTALSVVSLSGLADLGFLEDRQFSATRDWTGNQKANLRLLDAAVQLAPVPHTLTTTDAGVWHSVPGATFALATGKDAVVDLLFYASVTSGGSAGQTFGARALAVVRNPSGTPTAGGGAYSPAAQVWSYDETGGLVTGSLVQFVFSANTVQLQVKGPAGPQDINWSATLTPQPFGE